MQQTQQTDNYDFHNDRHTKLAKLTQQEWEELHKFDKPRVESEPVGIKSHDAR